MLRIEYTEFIHSVAFHAYCCVLCSHHSPSVNIFLHQQQKTCKENKTKITKSGLKVVTSQVSEITIWNWLSLFQNQEVLLEETLVPWPDSEMQMTLSRCLNWYRAHDKSLGFLTWLEHVCWFQNGRLKYKRIYEWFIYWILSLKNPDTAIVFWQGVWSLSFAAEYFGCSAVWALAL